MINLDYYSDRMYPFECERPDVRYNMFLYELETGIKVGQAVVNQNRGYGLISIKNLTVGNYTVKVVNYGDKKELSDFEVSI